MRSTIEKILSANDAGETYAHQAGLVIPKNIAKLGFFPELDPAIKNPRCVVDLKDATGEEWSFNYIYYNNSLFGGTRNEYRMTAMTEFIRRYDLKAGDTVIFSRPIGRFYGIDYKRKDQPLTTRSDGKKMLKLTGNWMVLDTDGFA